MYMIVKKLLFFKHKSVIKSNVIIQGINFNQRPTS